MFGIYICIAVGVLVFVMGTIWSIKKKECEIIPLFIFLGLLASLLSILFWIVISFGVDATGIYKPVWRYIPVNSTAIYSLNNTKSCNGNFILGSGTIGEIEMLMFFVRNQDGGYERNRVGMEKSIIYEDCNSEKPYVDMFEYTCLNKSKWVLLLNQKRSIYKFHVPNGTIIQRTEIR